MSKYKQGVSMKGVILAGGLGTRLYPLTYATNKHLLPIYDKPMVFYPIQTLVRAGISDIIIVTGGPHAGHFLRVLKNGKELGIKHLEYAYQEGEGGIAAALSLCQEFVDKDNVIVILGDNTTDADLSKDVKEFKRGAKVFLKEVPDLERFGVPVFDPKNPKKILKIEEKPKKPKSEYAVTGLYMYDQKVWGYIKKTKPSGRGELEITDVNNFYIKAGTMRWAEIESYWYDAGNPETMLKASNYWASKTDKGM